MFISSTYFRYYRVELSFFNNNDEWESIGDRLVVDSSQWRYVAGQNEDGTYIYGIEESVTFESINILLRRLDSREATKIDAIALTQEQIFDSKSVPEPTSVFGLLVTGALGIVRWNRPKK
ncbi:MAG: PEP-CTERM sorting domain-containing protein [Okeania sp. SIO2F4]|uniref:PEP-CTERM sorting domain-containing protein n=1 Tax=Okeania sp. SIO2F4 TaxID=2607790 RepID=UPI00142C43C2|nr:PEP-CTERM sorting domain-containing protein [Okeania sp. SIO2F4]